ncbi:fibronectin type III domain-containing protein [Candidatus Wolfebacteria bacterium]|nr:fibronectin type III domain-containing protein [Candidatus Wolfebacteria bacterium]
MLIKLKIIFVLTLFFSAISAGVFGHGNSFFEFTPNTTSQSLTVSVVETPYQFFKPYNDFIGGFDIWISNTGSAGSASFGLRDQNDNLLAAKTVSVPYVAEKWGGAKLHVDFDTPINVSSTANYKIKMLSSMPKLKIYYAEKNQLLVHNTSQYFLADAVGPARLGSVDQDFAFKFALYEGNDNLAPIVSGASTSIISLYEAKIGFNANEPVDYKITFLANGGSNQVVDFNGNYGLCPEGIAVCSLSLKVEPDKIYNYQLTVKDEWGNEAQLSGLFESMKSGSSPESPATSSSPLPEEPPAGDTSPPVISNSRLADLSSYSAKIAWQTNEAADSDLTILNAAGSQKIVNIVDGAMELEHVLETGNVLNPKTQYTALLSSKDSSGNVGTQIIALTTLEEKIAAPNNNQEIVPNPSGADKNNQEAPFPQTINNSSLNVQFLENDGSGNMVISWLAPIGGEPTDGYRIDIFDENKELKQQIFVSSGTHEIKVNLGPGKYTIIVYANNGGLFEKVAEELVVTISEKQPFLGAFLNQSRIFFFAFMAIAAIVVLTALKLRKRKINAGFTIIEVMISFTVLAAVVLVVALFSQDIFKFSGFFSESLKTQQEVQQTFQSLAIEIRSMGPSSIGSYSIAEATTSTLVFYSDIDRDGLFERVKYFLNGSTLEKGVVKPTGNPLVYNLTGEAVNEVIHGVVATSSGVFSYYGADYTGSEPPMSFPINISDIRLIKAEISAQGNAKSPVEKFSILATPRNLRSN